MITIIICTYNRDKYIYQTLERIAQNRYDSRDYEIVLVNNCSTDKTESECLRFEKRYPEVPFRYFKEKNQGLSYARNRGIKESRGSMLVFLDDDAFVGENYLLTLNRYLEDNPSIMCFGGRIIPLFENGKEPKWLGKWSYSWLSALDKGERVCLFEGSQYPIGANMGISKEVIDRCGFFDVTLGRSGGNMMGGEEKDLFFRIKSLGIDIYYLPEISVKHCIPESRQTKEYVIRLAQGVGKSEYMRTREKGLFFYFVRCIQELIKWSATIFLFLLYSLSGTPVKGWYLTIFRYYVSKGLIFKNR